MSQFPYVRDRINKILDNDDDLGEVAEWVERSAAQKQEDDDFDIEKPKYQSQGQLEHIEQARKRINDKLNRKSGPMTKNNLKDKAKMMAMKNNVTREEKDVVKFDSDEEVELPPGKLDDDGKVLRLSVSSHRSMNIEAQFKLANEQRVIVENKPIEQIEFVEAWDQLKSSDSLRSSIQFNQTKISFTQKLFGCFVVHLKSHRLIQEKQQIISLSLQQFDDNNQTHFRVLYSVYTQFMNTDYCLRYGSHWENIGFQGRDPATDLRGAGILGLLQILAYLTHYKIYIQKCQEMSQQQIFPLCITLINITTFVLIALKENKLNHLINVEDSVMSIVNKLYFAGFWHFFKQYKSQNGNFHNIGNILNNTRKIICESPEQVINDFQKGISLFYKSNK